MDEFVKAVQIRVDHFRNNGESMEQIAQRAGITRVHIYNILRGTHVPSLEVADKIATGLGLEISVK